MLHSVSMYRYALGRTRRSITSIVSASLVKELRERSGAPMMECKKALADPEVSGDLERAADWLRKRGIAKAAKGGQRNASEGLVGVYRDEPAGRLTVVEVSSETDFVGRNEDFQSFVFTVAASAANNFPLSTTEEGNVPLPALLDSPAFEQAVTVRECLGTLLSRVREDINIKRVHTLAPLSGKHSLLAEYVHCRVGLDTLPSQMQLGRTVAVVELAYQVCEGVSADRSMVKELVEVGRRLGMLVVATVPEYVQLEDVPVEVKQREQAIFEEQAALEEAEKDPVGKKKSPELMKRAVQGRLDRRLAEMCLLSQPHVAVEGQPIVSKHLAGVAAKLKLSKLTVKSMLRWSIGTS